MDRHGHSGMFGLLLVFTCTALLLAAAAAAAAGDERPAAARDRQTQAAGSLATSSALPGVIFAGGAMTPTLLYSRTAGACWEEFAAIPSGVAAYAPLLLASRADGSPRFLTSSLAQQVYRSGDFGHSWFSQPLGPELMVCFDSCDDMSLVASPVLPTRLYMAANDIHPDLYGSVPYAYLLYSADSGVSWQAATMPGRGQPFSRIRQVLASPVLPQRVYLNITNYSAAYTDAWYRSDDGGNTWVQMGWRAADSPGELALDPAQPETVYVYQPEEDRGYRRIGDHYEDWASSPACSGFSQFLTHVDRSGILLLRCDSGLHVSDDGGDSWKRVAENAGIYLAQDLGMERMLWWREDGLYASQYDGAAWTKLSSMEARCQGANYLPAIGK